MAKRSDFAQKLLDDLRLRKERLASSSQSSNRSNSTTAIIDPYSYARQNYRGSKDSRTNDMIGSRTGSARNNKSNNGIRGASIASESTHHIVPYNNGRSHQALNQTSDLSTVLSFALENGGKIISSRTDSSSRSSIIELLQRIGTKSMDQGMIKTESRSTRFPAFSESQIEEISKGVQRMNQILRGNLDRESIKIGKELLKGAMGLEKSLKVSVVEPHRKKNRIKLIDEFEDEDGKVAEEWKLDRSRFPFEKKEIERTGLDQNKLEKARIPNVIAKLMGLENLPEEGSFRRSGQEIESMKANPFVVNTSFAVVRERNSSGNIRIEATKNKNSLHLLPRKRQPERQYMSNSKIEKSHNVHMEIQKPVNSVSDERDQSLKHRVKAISSKISSKLIPEKKLNKKSVRKSANSVQVQSEPSPNVDQHRDESVRQRSDKSKSYKDANNYPKFSSRPQLEVESRRPRTRLMQTMDEKAVRVQNGKVTKIQNKGNGALNSMTGLARNRSSVLNDVKPEKIEKLIVRKDEAKPDRSEEVQELIKDNEEKYDNGTNLRESENSLEMSRDLSQNKIPEAQLNQVMFCGDSELKCDNDVANELDVFEIAINESETPSHEETITSKITTAEEETKPTEPNNIPILTQEEIRLEQILIKSQLFLNTAEALFSLEIPITTLHSSANHQEEEEEKAILDCGYELMRRKGQRHEMSVHPNFHAEASRGFVAIKTFDGLVRELCKDFEKLRERGFDEFDILVGMKESDVNCMWDLGWNESVFAFVEFNEVVRDVEKFLLNCLLDQVTSDFYFSSY